MNLPPLMQDLATDSRGLPIPFVVLIDKEGTPHFKINDSEKEAECIAHRLCHICGKPLRREFWMIGGQISAYHPQGVWNDPPVHRECGIFALQNCPYFLNSKYKSLKEEETKELAKAIASTTDAIALYNPTQTQDRVSFFVFARTKDFTTVQSPLPGVKTIRAVRPYLEVEYYCNGKRIHRAEALQLLKDNNEKSYLP